MSRTAITGSVKKAATPKTARRSNPVREPLDPSASLDRIAIALETIAGLLACALESFEPDTPDGEARCVFRTYDREFQLAG